MSNTTESDAQSMSDVASSSAPSLTELPPSSTEKTSTSATSSKSEPPTTTAKPSTVIQDVVTTVSNPNTTPDVTTKLVTSVLSEPTPPSTSTVQENATSSGAGAVISSPSSTTASDSQTSGSSGGDGGGGGLHGTPKVVVAVVIPIVVVALIAAGLLFFWKKRKTEASKMKRKSEVEDYSYNPNAPGGAVMGGMGTRGGEDGEAEMTEGTGGYRGWGSTTGGRGRKVSMMNSSVGSGQPLSPSTMGFADAAYLQPGPAGAMDGHGSMATSPTVSSFPPPSTDGNQSNAPLVRNRSGATDSSGHGVAVSYNGVHRGDSNASSNYSAMTRSDSNSENAHPPSPYEHRFSGQEGVYDEANNYSGQPYFGSPPIIRDVSARRNTQIQTPTSEHYPQQGNSGIAQNF